MHLAPYERYCDSYNCNNNNNYNICRALNTDVSKRFNQIDRTDGFIVEIVELLKKSEGVG